jgi:hypothetical protein
MAVSFKEKVKTLFKLFKSPKELSAMLSLRHSGYLIDKGWFSAFNSGKPVDINFKPIPWFTYSFIDFLESRLNKNIKLLEFGSGNSTLYFSERVDQVVSLEHNLNYYNKLEKLIPANVELILSKSDSASNYVSPTNDLQINFDIIIVDGIYRNECCIVATEMLSSSGVIILDDSERAEYQEGTNQFISKGFKRLDFDGISAGYLYQKTTSVFYKPLNCLNI